MQLPLTLAGGKQTSTLVVTLTLPRTLVTLLGINCHVGVEPTDAAPRITKGVFTDAVQLAQLAGLCSLLPLPATDCIVYSTKSVCQFNS